MSLGEAAIVRLPVVGDRLYEWALPRKNSLTGAGLLMEVADNPLGLSEPRPRRPFYVQVQLTSEVCGGNHHGGTAELVAKFRHNGSIRVLPNNPLARSSYK